MKKYVGWMVIGAMLIPAAAAAQESGLVGACAAIESSARPACLVVAQAVESAQPKLGILLSGGNPTPGTASTGGLKLGMLPGVSLTVRANAVSAHIPDVREIHTGPTDGQSYGELRIVAPSLSATATLGVFPGVSIAPTIGGIGAVDLLGSASWLPLRSVGSDDFRPGTADVAYGGGVRVGLLRESFLTPGASVSLMYHRLGTVAYGQVCPTGVTTSTTHDDGYTLTEGECVPSDLGDLGEFSFDLSNWSARAAVSKHLLGLGLAAGVGYDRLASDLAAGVRAPQGAWPSSLYYARVSDVTLEQGRWSAFVDGSFSLLVASLAAEVGWQQGGNAVAGYPANSDFDPGKGTLFGSVGLRVAL
ncbi:MAG TPA: hypothetical protein VFL93_05245 [Longimicrobiaceae bacterium]|nr:hypothetical protein [Longimicrobiaceae bacterium]